MEEKAKFKDTVQVRAVSKFVPSSNFLESSLPHDFILDIKKYKDLNWIAILLDRRFWDTFEETCQSLHIDPRIAVYSALKRMLDILLCMRR